MTTVIPSGMSMFISHKRVIYQIGIGEVDKQAEGGRYIYYNN